MINQPTSPTPTYNKKTTRVTSRLARKQSKEMKKQTIWLVALAIIILLVFIFVIMPGGISLFFKMLDAGGGALDIGDNIPPQAPVLSSPPTATYSATLAMNGYGEPGSEVVFVLDSSKVATVKINDDGDFTHDLDLAQGDNDLILYGVDSAGNESTKTKTYSIYMDNEAPSIVIEEPQEGAQIELRKNQLTTIKGTTEPNARVFINGRLSLANSEGNFKTTYQLNEGENKLEIKSIDKAGNESVTELIVHFKY